MPESYTRTNLGAWSRAREAITLYQILSNNMEAQVTDFLNNMRTYRAQIEQLMGGTLQGKKIFEIGPGQLLKNARFFGAHNDVVAVDLDEIVNEWSIRASWNMFRKNGPLRFFKTVIRKSLGIDRRFTTELARQLPESAKARIEVLQRDAANTGLPSASFDCSLSFSVFEHLSEPRLVLKEIIRLLRPGGVAFHVIHCFTSDSGAHDVRSFVVDRSNFPYWCHLRPDTAHLVSSNTYVNRLSISDWKQLIADELPGAKIVDVLQTNIPRIAEELRLLRATDALKDYSDSDLMTVALEVSWIKPDSFNVRH